MNVTLDIAATDDEATIREKIAAILDPLAPDARRRVISELGLQLQAIECAAMKHAGIGLPGCPTCAPRTKALLSEADDGHEWNCGRSEGHPDPLCERCQA